MPPLLSANVCITHAPCTPPAVLAHVASECVFGAEAKGIAVGLSMETTRYKIRTIISTLVLLRLNHPAAATAAVEAHTYTFLPGVHGLIRSTYLIRRNSITASCNSPSAERPLARAQASFTAAASPRTLIISPVYIYRDPMAHRGLVLPPQMLLQEYPQLSIRPDGGHLRRERHESASTDGGGTGGRENGGYEGRRRGRNIRALHRSRWWYADISPSCPQCCK